MEKKRPVPPLSPEENRALLEPVLNGNQSRMRSVHKLLHPKPAMTADIAKSNILAKVGNTLYLADRIISFDEEGFNRREGGEVQTFSYIQWYNFKFFVVWIIIKPRNLLSFPFFVCVWSSPSLKIKNQPITFLVEIRGIGSEMWNCKPFVVLGSAFWWNPLRVLGEWRLPFFP